MQDHRHAGHGAPQHEHEHPHVEQTAQSKPSHAEHSHGVDHTGHELMFRNRFWVSLLLTIPVLIFSPMIQMWLGFTAPEFPGSE